MSETRRTITSKTGPFGGKIRGYSVDIQQETKDINNVSTRALREHVYKKTGSKGLPNSLSRQQLINLIKG